MGQVLGCVRVKQSKVAVREHFGKFDGVLQPGCHCLPWCFGYEVAGELSLRVQQIWLKSEAKTKDNVFVNVTTSVQFRPLPEKVEDAFYKLKNTTHQIQAYAYSAIRASIAKLELDAVFEQQNGIAKAVQDELEKSMAAYGFEMIETLIVQIVPDDCVKKAMNENAVSKQLQKENRGIAHQRKVIEDGVKDSVIASSCLDIKVE